MTFKNLIHLIFMENKISVSLATESQTAIADALATIEKHLPFLISLSSAERQLLPKMGDKSLAFVYKTFEHAKQNPALVPSYLDMAELEKDVNLVVALNRVLKPLAQITEKLDDTALQAGSEAYTASLIFYTAVKAAAKAGVPGTKSVYEDLQARFPGRSKASNLGPAAQN